jgi:hypothetical protein
MAAKFGDFISNFTRKQQSIIPEIAAAFGGRIATSSAKAQRELGYRVID